MPLLNRFQMLHSVLDCVVSTAKTIIIHFGGIVPFFVS
jgi:hypothetical protein